MLDGITLGCSVGDALGDSVGIMLDGVTLGWSLYCTVTLYIAEKTVAVAIDELDGSIGIPTFVSAEFTTAFRKQKVLLVNFVTIFSFTVSVKLYGSVYDD